MTSNSATPDESRGPGRIIASGGIIAKPTPRGIKIAVIYRPKYKDWCLPKGKVKEGETIQKAAEREVLEETYCEVRIDSFAGTTTYFVDDTLKTVYFWHMTIVKENTFKATDEVEKLLWLLPHKALRKLTHEEERHLLAQTMKREIGRPGYFVRLCRAVAGSDLRGDRLRGSITTYRSELEGKRTQAEDDANKLEWLDKSMELLDSAEINLRLNKIDVGWQCFHAARRMEVFAMDDNTLKVEAKVLLHECEKIRPWRAEAVKKILAPLEKPEDKYSRKQIFDAMLLIQEHYNNIYYKIGLFRRQLTILAAAFGVIILIILILAIFDKIPALASDNLSKPDLVIGVIILGILGGALSSFFSIIRTPKESSVPDQVINGPVTTMRVLVGAASALAIFVLVQSSLFEGIFKFEVESKATILFLAFVSGYSERFVQRAVTNIAERE